MGERSSQNDDEERKLTINVLLEPFKCISTLYEAIEAVPEFSG